MLLTCPKCRSGLEVPDGTTAMVRCPACKTVFSPEDSPAPEPEEDEEEAPKPKNRKAAREDDDKPRTKKGGTKERAKAAEEPKEKNRDFDPISEEEERKRKRKKRRSEADEKLTPEERAARRRAFNRAATGARCIWISFALFMLSMVIVLIFFFQAGFGVFTPTYITIAGLLGIFNWVLGAVGIAFCLSGPRAPGHWGYGIAAATTAFIHLFFLLVLVAQGKEYSVGQMSDEVRDQSNARWGLIPTRLDATMFYLTAIIYQENQGATPKGPMLLSMITGLIEMMRAMFIMMLLSCLSRAALDEDLAHKCTRAAGVVSFGPGILGLLIFAFIATMIETGAGLNLFTMILFVTVNMGVYAIIIGVIFPSFMAARDVADACDEPFQSLIPQL